MIPKTIGTEFDHLPDAITILLSVAYSTADLVCIMPDHVINFSNFALNKFTNVKDNLIHN